MTERESGILTDPGEKIETEATKEKGANVSARVKLMRHGERTKDGKLTDYGREVTRKKAQEGGLKERGFDAVKAYGSQAGPKVDKKAFPLAQEGMGRALETASIFAEEIEGLDKKHTPRERDILNFENIKSTAPYDHTAVYNANLPENYLELSDEEKVEANRKAQAATVNHVMSLEGAQADAYKREVAGAFAKVVNHVVKLSERLDNGSKILLVEGTHGPMPEFLLQQAMVRVLEDGQEVKGFESIDEIGGPLYPSESIDVIVERDGAGNLGKIKIEIGDGKSILAREIYLDPEKLDELEAFYNEVHSQEK